MRFPGICDFLGIQNMVMCFPKNVAKDLFGFPGNELIVFETENSYYSKF